MPVSTTRHQPRPTREWRWWHKWLGILLALPLLLVALTAILLAHDKALGLRQIPVAVGWLPGYGAGSGYGEAVPGIEIRAAQRLGDVDYYATRLGLFLLRDGRVEAVAALRGVELRGLAVAGEQLYAAARNGIWGRSPAGDWRLLLRGEAWSITIQPDGALLAATRERGLMLSRDGGVHWQAEATPGQAIAEQSGIDPSAITLNRLVLDLHTGKALLGKDYEWLWIDLLGATMLFLGVSGLIMWWRARRQRLRLEQMRQARAAQIREPVQTRA